MGFIAQTNPVLDQAAQRRHHLNQWGKAAVEENRFVFCMVDDESELIGMQAGIAGVHDHAATRYSVIRLQMAVIIPSDRTHHTARFQAKTLQGIGKLFGAVRHIPEGVAVQRAVRFSADHLLHTKLICTMLQNGRDQKWPRHHFSKRLHIFFPKQLFLSIDNGLKAAVQRGLNKLFATMKTNETCKSQPIQVTPLEHVSC